MKKAIKKLEDLMEIGGIKKDILLLVIAGVSIICSLLHVQPFPFDLAWFAVILCGVPIILEAIIGLVKSRCVGFTCTYCFDLYWRNICSR